MSWYVRVNCHRTFRLGSGRRVYLIGVKFGDNCEGDTYVILMILVILMIPERLHNNKFM